MFSNSLHDPLSSGGGGLSTKCRSDEPAAYACLWEAQLTIPSETIRSPEITPYMSCSVQSRASTDGPAPTCFLLARWSVDAAGAQVAPANKGDIRGPRSSVLERLSQAIARLVSHRPLRRDIIDRTGLVPPDQQENRQSVAAAAGRRGHARAGRGREQRMRLRVCEERLRPSG